MLNGALYLLSHHHLLLLNFLGPALLLLFFPFVEVVALVDGVVLVEDFLELTVCSLLDSFHGNPCVPNGLQPLIGELIHQIISTFFVSVVLETPLTLFSEFIESFSEESFLHFSKNSLFELVCRFLLGLNLILPLLKPVPQLSMPSPLIKLLELICAFSGCPHLFNGQRLIDFFELVLDGLGFLLHFHIHHHFLLLLLFSTFFIPLGPSVEQFCPIDFVYLGFDFVIQNYFVMLVDFAPMIKIRLQNLRKRPKNSFFDGTFLLDHFSFFPGSRYLG